jgi:hypothetical protein
LKSNNIENLTSLNNVDIEEEENMPSDRQIYAAGIIGSTQMMIIKEEAKSFISKDFGSEDRRTIKNKSSGLEENLNNRNPSYHNGSA